MFWNLLIWFPVLVVVTAEGQSSFRQYVSAEEKTSNYWERLGQAKLRSAIGVRRIEKVAKNVILFLGDGMGITTVTSMRIYKGQKNNRSGEDELLSFDEFPFVSLSKTYGVDRQTSDSANTATAYLCGVKANFGTLGLDGRVVEGDCPASLDNATHVQSIAQWAQDAGKATGLVTTTKVTDATPAGLYAHAASRDWETDSEVSDPRCKDIASQLVDDSPGRDLNVILGGGRKHFLSANELDADGFKGSRADNRNLLDEWMKRKESKRARFVFRAEELRTLKPDKVDDLLGLFHSDHLPYALNRPEYEKEFPSLTEMTETAIKVLRKNDNGYFLLVEGGHIDLAHHQNWAMKAMEEGVEFDRAIQRAVELTDEEDTLIVVTADHSHTFTMGGDYPMRGSNILGLGGISNVDNKTFTTLGYSNGPGYNKSSRDRNITEEEIFHTEYRQDSTVPLTSETHGGEDVAVYARGPMAHLYHGVHDQSYIPYVMGYASCIGPNKDHCIGNAGTVVHSYQWAPMKFLALGFGTYAFSIVMYF